ncbi:plasmid pRiA4b ORF-3 family protein [Mycolicibacterium brumae]|uniref:plasmid pRiA4b ORF-3 family protein n=1 Tax=Mycolicibacterium brumae TaxID=85968 RepID=UPI000A56084B|nr:plasmid pRiA4b ORF-3 family protein [Mycolicibacterium brumae]MCV7194316.1 plasmid pRiA4b ORF-3 family protein [Mycolicibacterium brumae]RWA20252.1 hypothetical protein MBRU_15400 [Mycolicibacterium brumae DSM 44177]UWW09669.1 plasmid pRiA4b ORF-3 family protein [Mycolicibacterium brumae]
MRAELDGSEPPIWRRLDIRCDLRLDLLHQALQAAFGWEDRHLHRFTLGGGPFDSGSQFFLCPFDVADGESDGMPAANVRVDETLAEPGHVLRYVYDYGDSWELTLTLEQLLPADHNSPAVVLVDGERAAPPEDSGGRVDAAGLAEVLDDPAHFDLDRAAAAVRRTVFTLGDSGIDPRLPPILRRLRGTSAGPEFAARLSRVLSDPPDYSESYADSLRAIRWFLDRAADGGIPLTSAGYMKPDDVEAASKVVPAMGDWIGKANREIHCAPLLFFREALRQVGLLRKYKGSLRLTRATAAVVGDPEALWDHLGGLLSPAGDGGFVEEATLTLLVYAGSADGELPTDSISAALRSRGWQHQDGRPAGFDALSGLPELTILQNISDRPHSYRDPDYLSPAASALARAALWVDRERSMG